MQLLLNDTNQEVVINILTNNALARMIDEESLLKIIQQNNVDYLCAIASNIDDFISGNICKIVKILSKHPNPSVRYSLVKWRVTDAISNKILEKFAEDEDIDIVTSAKKELKARK